MFVAMRELIKFLQQLSCFVILKRAVLDWLCFLERDFPLQLIAVWFQCWNVSSWSCKSTTLCGPESTAGC